MSSYTNFLKRIKKWITISSCRIDPLRTCKGRHLTQTALFGLYQTECLPHATVFSFYQDQVLLIPNQGRMAPTSIPCAPRSQSFQPLENCFPSVKHWRQHARHPPSPHIREMKILRTSTAGVPPQTLDPLLVYTFMCGTLLKRT